MLLSRSQSVRTKVRGQRVGQVQTWRPASPTLTLPRFSADVPLYHEEPSGAGHEILQGVAALLAERRLMRSYETTLPLEANLARALEAWAAESGLFRGLRCFSHRLTVREFGFNWNYTGGETPYTAFAIESKIAPPHVFLGRGLTRLREVSAALPAAVLSLIGNCTSVVQLWDFQWLLGSAEAMFWQGERDHGNVLKMLRAEIGPTFNPEEHLLPNGFFAQFPEWLFPRVTESAALTAALHAFVASPPQAMRGFASALDDFARAQRGTSRRLRTPFWDDLCENGADMMPLCVLRMARDDCGGRIVDGHVENQQNGEGFADLSGGYAGGAGDATSLARAWRDTIRVLGILQRLDALLAAFDSISA